MPSPGAVSLAAPELLAGPEGAAVISLDSSDGEDVGYRVEERMDRAAGNLDRELKGALCTLLVPRKVVG